MKKPFEEEKHREELRQSIIGLGERSLKKSYYPELQKRISQLEKANTNLLKEIREREKAEKLQRDMERDLRQAQKMQAIGTLAGGIAHDFNNILSAIVGYTELARLHASAAGATHSRPLATNLDGILKSADRAKKLVRRILSFSSQHEGELHPVDIGTIILDTIAMLRAMIPSRIAIDHDLKVTERTVLANGTQIQQVFMNLGTNALHSMHHGEGRIRFKLGDAHIRESDLPFSPLPLPAGDYLKIEVSDEGCGMDKKTLERVFEPYFTTKRERGGTGLGLAVVHGIITGHQGHISVTSEPAKGTTFTIYLPRISSTAELPGSPIEIQALKGGDENILVVDDEIILTRIMLAILENLGYRVTAFNSPAEAEKRFRNNPGNYDLVITDMNMPQMNGPELIHRLRQTRNDIPLILCTGYSELVDEEEIEKLGRARFLMKPFSVEELNRVIRELLS